MSGAEWLRNILDGNWVRSYQLLRMERNTFLRLCAILNEKYGLLSSQTVTVEEQVATFLMVMGLKNGNRQLQEWFQRSGYTISRNFHNVLDACALMANEIICPTNMTLIPDKIQNDRRLYPYFKVIDIWNISVIILVLFSK